MPPQFVKPYLELCITRSTKSKSKIVFLMLLLIGRTRLYSWIMIARSEWQETRLAVSDVRAWEIKASSSRGASFGRNKPLLLLFPWETDYGGERDRNIRHFLWSIMPVSHCIGNPLCIMPVSHYRESPEDPLEIPQAYALTLRGSPGDQQGICFTPVSH